MISGPSSIQDEESLLVSPSHVALRRVQPVKREAIALPACITQLVNCQRAAYLCNVLARLCCRKKQRVAIHLPESTLNMRASSSAQYPVSVVNDTIAYPTLKLQNLYLDVQGRDFVQRVSRSGFIVDSYITFVLTDIYLKTASQGSLEGKVLAATCQELIGMLDATHSQLILQYSKVTEDAEELVKDPDAAKAIIQRLLFDTCITEQSPYHINLSKAELGKYLEWFPADPQAMPASVEAVLAHMQTLNQNVQMLFNSGSLRGSLSMTTTGMRTFQELSPEQQLHLVSLANPV